MLSTLNFGSTKHLAAATIDDVNTPPIPTGDTNSLMFGVSRNGTGRLASNSPEKKNNQLSNFAFKLSFFTLPFLGCDLSWI